LVEYPDPYREGGRVYAGLIKLVLTKYAEVAHLVEHDLAKVGVAGSSPVFRSKKKSSVFPGGFFFNNSVTRVVELVDTQDLKSCSL